MSFTGQATIMPAPKASVPAGEMSFTGQKTSDKITLPSPEPVLNVDFAESKDRYKIVEKIGQGGMGIVYKAEDLKLGRIVALKRLLTKEEENRLGIERFLKEAQAIARLNHRNIVMVYDIGKDDAGYYIVMEYVDGVVLNVHIKAKGKLTVPDSLSIVKGVASALGYAHKKGIVHRDIKPGNIMLGKENVPRILDFGLAKIGSASQLSMSGMAWALWIMPRQSRSETPKT
jgi:serine/threonine-protein kinase